MLELRAHADANVADECVRALDAVDGVTHITLVPSVGGTIRITADIDPPAVDAAFVGLERAGVPPDSMGVWRGDWIAPVGSSGVNSNALMWAELLGSARAVSRVVPLYVVLMIVAGAIAGYGVILSNPVLIVGAMAVSPDLLPIVAASVGIIGRRWTLVRRALVTLTIGLGLTTIAAALLTLALGAVGLLARTSLDSGLVGGLTTFGVGTVGVALAAGVAGMVAFETRASSAVGVAISVTTIPAAAAAGVAAGTGDVARLTSALVVLLVNVAALLVAASATLIVQRALQDRAARRVRSGER